MRIGVSITYITPFVEPRDAVVISQAAEKLGFATIWRGEHVLTFPKYTSKYPYTLDSHEEGKKAWLTRPDIGIPETFLILMFIAAHTSRIRLGTGICIVPQRNPVYTASMSATLDMYSNGRLIFGAGLGWSSEEYQALGVPWKERGKRMDEYLELIKMLWTQSDVEFHGITYELPHCMQYPKPIQKPHPPIYIGGEGDAALTRVVRHANGWYGMGLDPDQVRERRKRLVELCAQHGRDPSTIQVAIAPYFRSVTKDEARRYADAGVDELIIMMSAPTVQEHIDLFEAHAALTELA